MNNLKISSVPRCTVQVVTFELGDPENPRNWPRWKKLLTWIPLIALDLTVSLGASGFSPASAKWREEFHVSSEVAVLGLSVYALAMGFGTLLNAPASEYFGRLPIYLLCTGFALPFYIGLALAPNLGAFLAFRFICGFFQSVTVSNIGGTIADLYDHVHTGPAMSFFLWSSTAGSSLGFFEMSCVAQFRPWQDVFWAMLGIIGGIYLITGSILWSVGETRHSVILRRRAAKLREITGNSNIDVAFEYRRESFKEILLVTQSRPFLFLLTEAPVLFAALYNGYMYGINFLLIGALGLVFGAEGHGFNILQVGCCFLAVAAGITLGPLTNIFQERYYQRCSHQAKGANIPEARIRMSKVAAIIFPLSLFWFAWTSYRTISAAVPLVAAALWGWSFYTLILMTYQYNEDSYKHYAASALAGIGFVRNVAGAGFPLFGDQMFAKLGYQWAGSLLAFLALVTVPIPFVLEKYGKQLRKKSPWAGVHMNADSDDDEAEPKGPSSCQVEGNGDPNGLMGNEHNVRPGMVEEAC